MLRNAQVVTIIALVPLATTQPCICVRLLNVRTTGKNAPLVSQSQIAGITVSGRVSVCGKSTFHSTVRRCAQKQHTHTASKQPASSALRYDFDNCVCNRTQMCPRLHGGGCSSGGGGGGSVKSTPYNGRKTGLRFVWRANSVAYDAYTADSSLLSLDNLNEQFEKLGTAILLQYRFASADAGNYTLCLKLLGIDI